MRDTGTQLAGRRTVRRGGKSDQGLVRYSSQLSAGSICTIGVFVNKYSVEQLRGGIAKIDLK